jgi:hypothetical protein
LFVENQAGVKGLATRGSDRAYPPREGTKPEQSSIFAEKSAGARPTAEDESMPRWIRDKLTWIVVFAAIAAASSAYSAYKLYQMTDGRPVPTKSKR